MTTEIILTQQQRDLLKEYKAEAFEYFRSMEEARLGIKDVVEAAAEGTGLEKALVRKLYKAMFDSKVSEIIELAAQIQFLAEEQ